MTATTALLVAAGLVAWQGPQIVDGLASLVRARLQTAPLAALTLDAATGMIRESAVSIGLLAGWIVAAAWCAALAINLVQTGFVWAPAAVNPDVERLDPALGMRRLFSTDNFVTSLWSLAALTIAVLATAGLVMSWLRSPWPSVSAPVEAAAGAAIQETSQAAMTLAGLLVVLGIADVAWRRWRLEQSLRMTAEEAKEEAGRRKTPRRKA